jgi:hypothetical protein
MPDENELKELSETGRRIADLLEQLERHVEEQADYGLVEIKKAMEA